MGRYGGVTLKSKRNGQKRAVEMMMRVNMTGRSAVAGSVLCNPGPVRWHALFVLPQKEDQAEAWLRRRGVYGFHPVTTRRTTRAGRTREYHRRYLPGYVFARFPGEAMPHEVLACPFIQGALTRADGAWGVILPNDLRSLHAMRRVDEDADRARRAEERMRRRRQSIQRGEAALFKSGAFVGHHCEVVQVLADNGAKVSFKLFGREVLTTTPIADLVAIQRNT